MPAEIERRRQAARGVRAGRAVAGTVGSVFFSSPQAHREVQHDELLAGEGLVGGDEPRLGLELGAEEGGHACCCCWGRGGRLAVARGADLSLFPSFDGPHPTRHFGLQGIVLDFTLFQIR